MSLLEELKRRNVFRVAIAYVLLGWAVLQGADLLLDLVGAPAWMIRALAVIGLVGLPFAIFFAWAYELTPEGIKREHEVDRSQSITLRTGQRIDRLIILFLVVAVAFLLADRYLGGGRALQDAAAVAQRQSIAVLPFVNRSGMQQDAFFVDGVHDDLLTQLARISALKVISRTSVESYRQTLKSIPEIGQELGVVTVLEGSVQRAGDRIRINVQLIDAIDDRHLWADTYDRELTPANIFDIQSEIARAIAAELSATLTEEESERLALRPTENLGAYEAYLVGRQRLARRTASNMLEAIEQFQRSIDLDPGFALAYVGLADAWQLRVDYGGLSVREAIARAQPLVEKALQLDDSLGEAYASLASTLEFSGDYEAAEPAYLRAMELSPNYMDAVHWYALFLMQSRGVPEAAVPWFERAQELDPLSGIVHANLAVALESVGRLDEAGAVLERAVAIDPDFLLAHSVSAYIAHAVEGRLDEAARWQLKALGIDTNEPGVHADIAFIWSELGDAREADCWDARARELGSDSFYVGRVSALLALNRGDLTNAALYARRSLESNWIRFEKVLPLGVLTIERLQADRAEEALALFETHYPELSSVPQTALNRTNFKVAIDRANLLQKVGRQAEAEVLLDAIAAYIRGIPRLGEYGFWVDDARILALRGQSDAALDLLEAAVEEGWRYSWRYYLVHDPVFEGLRNHPRFQAAVNVVEAEMARQLERVRTLDPKLSICAASPRPAI